MPHNIATAILLGFIMLPLRLFQLIGLLQVDALSTVPTNEATTEPAPDEEMGYIYPIRCYVKRKLQRKLQTTYRQNSIATGSDPSLRMLEDRNDILPPRVLDPVVPVPDAARGFDRRWSN
jgi:hypothetical protein